MDDGILSELNCVEIRVLGSLMEKARTTPDIYPLTLNSLLTACNQKTSRDPVTDYDEDEVVKALDDLRDKGLVMRVDMAGSRTAKFRENASAQWDLVGQEYAILTLLFLRGPQTPGQLRSRSERLFEFAEIGQILDWLKQMQDREDEPACLVQSLERIPGTKEIRYAHTLAPLPETGGAPPPLRSSLPDNPNNASVCSVQEDSLSLENRVVELETRLAALENLINELTS